jgi:hypothetical protein
MHPFLIEPITVGKGALGAVKRWPVEKKLPTYSALSGLAPWSVCIVPHLDEINAMRMIAHRIHHAKIQGKFQVPLKPNHNSVARFKAAMMRFSMAFVERYGYAEPISRERVLEHCPPDKKALYKQALLSLEHEAPLGPKDMIDLCHGKIEKRMEFGAPGLAKLVQVPDSMAARPVRAKSTRFNIEWGKFVYAIEKKDYELIDHMFAERQRKWYKPVHKVVMKGLNAKQRGEQLSIFRQQVGVVYLDPDAEKWDFSLCIEDLKVEHMHYLSVFAPAWHREIKSLTKAMEKRDIKVRFAGGIVRFRTVGQRSSGVTNTSLGNIDDMCVSMHDFFESLPYWCDLIDDGDDTIVSVDANYLTQFRKDLIRHFRGLGISLKINVATPQLEKVTFCQCRLLDLTDGPRVVRVFPQALGKDTVVLHQYGEKPFFKHLLAVGECGLAGASGVPVYQAFYQMYIRWANKAGIKRSDWAKYLDDYSALRYLSKGMAPVASPVTEQNRLAFDLAFGFSVQQQLCLEARYESLEFDFNNTYHESAVLNTADRVDPLLSGWVP